ncbi:DUF3592 domain-containing protein [Streptomyces sp. NPDC015346]|uniref:DUF3592 domain-containing protein n=1 Tax=Streptomyces sp. NPDC015346 TaxID=3364954 RepID=UPI0036F98602
MTSPIPLLRGNGDTELRAEDDELFLTDPDRELRIPFAAIARVRAERRAVAVELTAPAGVEPTVYQVKDVSGAAATVFADAVNGALPARSAGEEAVDGSTLVTIRSLKTPEADDEDDEDTVLILFKRAAIAAGLVLVALSVTVGVVGGEVGRALGTLALGALATAVAFFAFAAMWLAWDNWYLPRYGITVNAKWVSLDGRNTHAYTDINGRTRAIYAKRTGETVRVSYHPRNPKRSTVHQGWSDAFWAVFFGLGAVAIAAALGYGTVLLVLPAFGG